MSPTQVAIAKPLIRVMSRLNTWAYRLTNGRIGGTYLHGVPVLLLTVVGRKSGRRLTVPLTYLKDGDRLSSRPAGGLRPAPALVLESRRYARRRGADGRRRAADAGAHGGRRGARRLLAETGGGEPRLCRLPGPDGAQDPGRRALAALKRPGRRCGSSLAESTSRAAPSSHSVTDFLHSSATARLDGAQCRTRCTSRPCRRSRGGRSARDAAPQGRAWAPRTAVDPRDRRR